MRHWTLLIGLLMALCAPSAAQVNDETHIEVNGAWARPSIEGRDISAAYFQITNLGEADDALVRAETDAAHMVELHTMQMDGDVMRMRQVEQIALPAGEMVALQPGGLHVMLMGLTRTLSAGDSLTLTLGLESGSSLEVVAWVSDTPIPNLLEPDALTTAALEADAAGTFVGRVVNPPVQAQPFSAPGTISDDQRLSDTDGTWRVLFFGYTHCPDYCPLTLVDYKEVKALLGEQAVAVTFVYVSVDAPRDTPEVLRTYLDHFDPEFIGFSADDLTLRRIQPDYGFYYQRLMGAQTMAVYSIDHSTRSYLIDPMGVIRASFAYDTAPSRLAEALRWYIAKG
jgi:protein SCO1/2